MNIRRMIDKLKDQIVALEEAVVQLEKLEAISTGQKKRGRPPTPKCDKGCGRPVHRGKCRGFGARKAVRKAKNHGKA